MCRTREHATKVSPEENSFFPMSMTTLSRVRPCALCIVTAQASLRGSCCLEQETPAVDHVRLNGVIGTLPSLRVGPEYESNFTVTATGRLGGVVPSL